MSRYFKSALKVFLFCFLIFIVQTSLVTDKFVIPVNLIFSSLIVFTCIFSLYEVIVASISYTILSSMLFYNGDIYWFYPIIGIIASKFNPDQIPDKFLVCILYTIFLTLVHEVFDPSSADYLDRTSEAVLTNLITMTPIYILLKFTYKPEEAWFQR